MNKPERDLRLLDKSIEHWERLVSGNVRRGETPYAPSCPLCRRYSSECYTRPETTQEVILACPIMEDTGLSGCDHTPWSGAALRWHKIEKKPLPGFKVAARRELAYLKNFRKKLAEKACGKSLRRKRRMGSRTRSVTRLRRKGK